MSNLNSFHKHGDNKKSHTTSTSAEQISRGREASKSSAQGLNTSSRKDHDPDNIKKSVLAKMRDKAKKLKHSLSHKKRHNGEEDKTPAWGVRLADYEPEEEEKEEDPEYHGAPMYESVKAPEGLRETARQHPREINVTSEKHVLPNVTKQGTEQVKDKPTSPNKTMTATIAEKLTPAYTTVSDATTAITSKIQGLAISAQAALKSERNPVQETNKNGNPVASDPSNKPDDVGTLSRGGSREQVWDKGVSVKEYIMQKFEPGEDERALSQAITDAISPRKNSSEPSVVERVRGVVSSLIWSEESNRVDQETTKSHSNIPLSSNATEVVEEENHGGRILQAN